MTWRLQLSSFLDLAFQQVFQAVEPVTLAGQLLEQGAEAGVELVRPPRAGADVQQQEEAVEPVRVLPLAAKDALEDRPRRDETRRTVLGVIRVRSRPGGVVDQAQSQ